MASWTLAQGNDAVQCRGVVSRILAIQERLLCVCRVLYENKVFRKKTGAHCRAHRALSIDRVRSLLFRSGTLKGGACI